MLVKIKIRLEIGTKENHILSEFEPYSITDFNVEGYPTFLNMLNNNEKEMKNNLKIWLEKMKEEMMIELNNKFEEQINDFIDSFQYTMER